MHPTQELAVDARAAAATATPATRKPEKKARDKDARTTARKAETKARKGDLRMSDAKDEKKARAKADRKPEKREPEKKARKQADRKAEKKADRKAEKKAKKKARKQRRTAATSDRHDLYQLSVQAPDVDAPFFAKYHRRLVGHPARVLREDFCGTAFLAAHWVTMHRENRAIGVDLDLPTLDWGRAHNLAALTDEQRDRLLLVHGDVCEARTPPCDVLVALNFSYSFFMTRESLRGYLAHARQDIVPGGLMFLDSWGGSETQNEQEEEREVEDFTYVWDQRRFDPVTYRSDCRIHFRFADGTELRNAFRYHWRQWTLPELCELMQEAGFSDVHVLWEGTDKKSGEGNGKYHRTTRGEADPAWLAYVVGRA